MSRTGRQGNQNIIFSFASIKVERFDGDGPVKRSRAIIDVLNHGGRTIFLEEDRAWIQKVTDRFPGYKAHHVAHDTRLHKAEKLLKTGHWRRLHGAYRHQLSQSRHS
ncbi:hypothetical protein SAY86_020470 [Trapa natans]|uniref:Uncharacterized protein n=1 Tax=Trapa natans TaxID=22666 RepID=A0AAN7R6J8_TRANT|nr:hypothetical protein SAY86_020470 [Trapa natans]